jgi:Tol biopolymer transport system component
MKYFLICVIVFFPQVGCNKQPTDEGNDTTKPQFQPLAVIVNPFQNSTVYDSTIIQIRTFFRGTRIVNLYIDDELKESVYSDTLKYKWLVNDYQKFSLHQLEAEVTYGDDDTLAFRDTTIVQVSHSMIAFSSNKNGNFQIYIMNEDGTQLRQVTNSSADALFPAWSPEGDKIAYVSEQNEMYSIKIYNLMDSTSSLFLEGDSNEVLQDLVWSSDHNKFAYVSNGNVITIKADKTDKKNVFSGFLSRHPSFGKKEELFFDYAIGSSYLGIIDTSGNPGNIDVSSIMSGRLIIPILKPNSRFLYLYNYQTNDLVYGSLSYGSTGWQLNNVLIAFNNMDSSSFSFSPNGKKVAVIGKDDMSIYIISYNGTTSEQILLGGKNLNPSWSKK